MNELASFISQVGFPIFVAIFMLYRSTKDNEKINATLTDLKVAITELSTLLKDHDENERKGVK